MSARFYKIGFVGNNWLVGNAVFSETAVRIFLIFSIKLGDYKGRKVIEPDFWKQFLIWRYLWKHPKISPKWDTLIFGWLVGNAVFSETALRSFMIFCIKLGDHKGRKVTELDIWKKLLIWRYSRKRFQISPKSDTLIFGQLVGSTVFSKMALRIFLIFCMKLGDYKDRKVSDRAGYLKKIIDLEIFAKRSPN